MARGYDLVADAYAELECAADWPRMRWLEDLLQRVPPHSRVLDLGCGSGLPATRAIVERGHAVIAVDVSREQLRRARRNVPQAEFVLASALDLDLAPGSLDAVVSFYVIEHMPRELHATLFGSIHGWLRDEGRLLLTFEVGNRPSRVDEWLGVPMFFSHHDSATNLRLVREAGFDVVRTAEETQIEGGSPVPYLWVLAQKRSD